ncbi:hypothetical protein Leryth_015018 [Lithospermum erythrorhizon]|nr:hypothetical protein Leryth_015018 [Lithospermum erythrorhizon]
MFWYRISSSNILVMSITTTTCSSKFGHICLYFLLLSLIPIISVSKHVHPSKAPKFHKPHKFPKELSPDSVCRFTPHPHFCKSILRGKDTSIFNHGRNALKHSASSTKAFHSTLNRYLKSPKKLSKTTIQALQDCQFLTCLNDDFLNTTYTKVCDTNVTIGFEEENLHTYLSATLTNQDTCLEGMQQFALESSVKDGVLPALANGTMSYSVSLGLFLHGWGDNGKQTTKQRFLQQRKLSNVTYSYMNRQKAKTTFPEVISRKLLQVSQFDDMNAKVKVNQTVVVDPNGSGNFTTISDAVAAAPNNTVSASSGYYLIHVVAGVYQEYVTIAYNKMYIMMIGDGINQTIITGNRSNIDGWTTFNTATFVVVGQRFVAMNITFRNTAGAIKHQAVAVRNGADLSTFYKCSFEGYQDTLYAHSLRQFYRECDIYGTIDFIFGNAAAVFQNCNIYPRRPLADQFNAITAQGRTDINQNTAFSMHNCTIKPAPDLEASIVESGVVHAYNATQTYLGRPWREYSRTVYMESFMDGFISPRGWIEWEGDFGLNTSYYAEYGNRGNGSVTSNTNRVTWVGLQQACTALGDHGEESSLPTLWDALPSIAVVGGQSSRKSSVLESVVGRTSCPRGSPNCIILAISPANQDIATSDAIKISALVNPQEPGKQNTLKHPEYKHLASRMGSEHLGKVLSKHLEAVIKSRIPGLQSLINKTILELETELSRLGKNVATDAGGKLYMIMEICRTFDGIFKEHLDGMRPGGDKVYNVFDNQLPAALKRLQFDKNLSIDNVRKLITQADGYQPHLIAPEQGYRRLIESSVITIKGPAESAVDAVHAILKDLVQKSMSETSELKQYPSLRVEVSKAAIESLERMRDESKRATLQLVDMECSYLTVDFFRKLPQDTEKGGNPSQSIFDRYNDSYLTSS